VVANEKGVLRSRSNSHPYFVPLDSSNYSDAETCRDFCTTAEIIQDADATLIPWEEKQDALTGTTWEFVDQWTEYSGTDVSDPQPMTCDYSGCGLTVFKTPCYFKAHLKSHSDQILSESIKTGTLKCTWNLDCEKKAPFTSSKALRTHIEHNHLNQSECLQPYIASSDDHEPERRTKGLDIEDQNFEFGRDRKTSHHEFHPPCSSNKSSRKAEQDNRPPEKMTTFDTAVDEKQPLFYDFQLPNHPKKKETRTAKFSRDRSIGIEHFAEPTITPRWQIYYAGGKIYPNPTDPSYGR